VAKNFDPRYDPAFQPGYEGPDAVVGRSAVVQPVETRRATVVDPVELVTPRALIEPAGTSPAGRSLLSSPPPPAALIETRGNPWLLALWIVAAVFVVGGIAAQFAARSLLTSGNAAGAIDYYVVPYIMVELSPWFTLAGLFAGVAAIVLSAIRWRPGPE
jgi:hypothetical protein